MNWLRRLLLGTPKEPPHTPELDAKERQIVDRLADATGLTADQVRIEQRKRALALEVKSMRHR